VMFLVLVTLISLVLAVTMTVIAWRVSQEEERRSAARVAALAADIHDPGGVRREPVVPERDLLLRPAAAAAAGEMFVAASESKSGGRLAVVVLVGAIVFGSAAAVAVVFGRGATGAGRHSAAAAIEPARPNPPAPVPLELVALGHERDGDQLTVRGIVRNPRTGTAINGLTAVVFLFAADGGFSGSGRAAVGSAALGPGNESTFVVTVPGARDVARYRVSFRTDDRVVPHVDRRDRLQEKS
jgi:flagellar basal body-associated protein FliL